jgi:hypothetical protein
VEEIEGHDRPSHPVDLAIVVLTPPFLLTAVQGVRLLRLLRIFRLVAQRFMAPTVEHVESAEDDLLVQVQDISTRLGRLERALRERTQAVVDV